MAEVLTVRRDQGGEDGREAVCRPAGSLQKDEAGPIDMASGIGFLNGSGSWGGESLAKVVQGQGRSLGICMKSMPDVQRTQGLQRRIP